MAVLPVGYSWRMPKQVETPTPMASALRLSGPRRAIAMSTALSASWLLVPLVIVALAAVLPLDTGPADLADDIADPLGVALGLMALAALALGLAQRRRLSWILGAVLLASVVVVQALALRNPAGAALGAVVLALVIAGHGSFGVRSGGRRVAVGAAIAIVAAALLLLAATVAGTRPTAGSLGQAVEDLAGALAFTGLDVRTVLDLHGVLVEVLVTVLRLLVVVLAMAALLAAPVASLADTAARERMRRIARDYGHGALLPYQLDGDKQVFSPDGLGAAVSFGRAGRTAVALGDPIGPPEATWEAFSRFAEACRASGLVPTVYQASDASRGLLAAHGFLSIMIGREAVVDLTGFSLAGSRRANLRHTVTRAQRGGASVEVHLDGLDAAARERLGPGLRAIEDAWRAEAGPELGFTIGRFDPARLDRTAIAVATEADGRPTAFATFLPTGVDGGWALDLMRRRPGGTPGAFEACIAAAATAMRDRGAPRLSLGLAPLSGLGEGSARWEERLLARLAARVKPWYDVSGLEFFKSKFDPAWEPRYAAAASRVQLMGMVIALLRLHVGGFRHVIGEMAASALQKSPGGAR